MVDGAAAAELRLQPLVRARVRSLGAAGRRWVTELPALLAELEHAWGFRAGRSLPGGSASYVVRVARHDGAPAVLKLALPDDQLAAQIRTLQDADGRGYVRLLAHDLGRRALLMEALGPSLQAAGGTPEDQLRVLADTLRRAWRVGDPPDPAAAVDKAGSLHALVSTAWDALDRPCPENVVAQALAYAESLTDPEPTDLVVVHGDPHPGNALRVLTDRPGAETGYCFVDPDGFVADRAYDLGVAVRDWSRRLDPTTAHATVQGYCRMLAQRTGVDADRIRRWGFLERVSTGLYVLSFGAELVARPFLQTAEWLLDPR